jgi:hypothetical protein
MRDTTPANATELTRQQLEELDALLQRMLALTQKAGAVVERETSANTTAATLPAAAPPPAEHQKEPATSQGEVAHLPAESLNDASKPDDAQHLENNKNTSPDTATAAAQPPSCLPAVRLLPCAEPIGGAIANEADLPLAIEEVDNEKALAVSPWSTVPWLLLPFALLTHIYDKIFGQLGLFGRLICSAVVKYLLGISGCILLCYTTIWYLQTQGIGMELGTVPWTIDDWQHTIEALSRWWHDTVSRPSM